MSFAFQDTPSDLHVWTDTDHAGCRESRKSTRGGVIMFGSHCLKSWSSTQSVIAISFGEAEFYGIVKGGSQGLGAKGIIGDLGVMFGLVIHTAASAARGIALRKGLGKVRHIEVSQLWIQNRVSRGDIRIEKVSTSDNVAVSLTKHVDRVLIGRHIG